MLAGVQSAFAYDELDPPTGKDCNECHGLESGDTSPTVAGTRKGPHGGYSTGTQKCQTCHTLHNAPIGSVMLLPAETIKDTCNSCHDGTGGKGVYGVLEARGVTVESSHRIEFTNLIPGGAPSGAEATATFSASGGLLTCSDCHSPHNANTVDPFLGDRIRESTPTAFPGSVSTTETNRLLRVKPVSADTTVTTYGSLWCGACHVGRLSGSAGVVNHPVETDTAGFDYSNVVRVAGVDTTTTDAALGPLGGDNFGYVMPVPRAALQAGHYPLCQQCHEDARHVGDDPALPQGISTQNGFNEDFTITTADGATATDNPRFQVFPHESANARLLVEIEDDLCLNCHVPPFP